MDVLDDMDKFTRMVHEQDMEKFDGDMHNEEMDELNRIVGET